MIVCWSLTTDAGFIDARCLTTSADFDGLRRSLSLIPWSLLDGVGADEAVDTFYELPNSVIADHVPTVVLRRRVPPWFDGAVRATLRLKEAAHRRLRR